MRNAVLIGLLSSISIACSGSDAPDAGTNGGAGAGGGGTAGAGGSGAAGSRGESGAGASGGAGTAGTGAAGASGGAGTAGTGAAGASGGGTSGAAGTDASAGTSGAAGTAGGAGTNGASGSAGNDTDGGPNTGPFPPVTDFQAPGPFGSSTVTGTGPNNGYTVYRPQQLAPNGAKNPIVGWMSGGATSHTGYTLLPHLATHGFVVVAADVIPGIGQEVALGQQIVAGIDWAIAEATRQGSQFFEKLGTTKIAAMGYSMGSLATFTIANNAKLTTTVHISGGNMMPERVNNLRAPAAFICGRTGTSSCSILSADCDIAAVNCDTDFSGAKTPVFYGNFPGGHLGILSSPHMERIRGVTTAWLRWQLMQDSTLRTMFVGPQCTLCTDANWKVQQKNL